MTRLVITGTGRNGTGYIAAVLRATALRTGHEGVYGPCQAIGCQPVKWYEYQAEASWLAVPVILRAGPDSALAVRVQLRHPLDTIDSLLRLGLFDFSDRQTHNPYRAAIASTAPEVFAHETPVQRAAHFVTVWPWIAGDYPTYRVEDVASSNLQSLLDYPTASRPPAVPDDVNSDRAPKPEDWSRTTARRDVARLLRDTVPGYVFDAYRERYEPWYPDAAYPDR